MTLLPLMAPYASDTLKSILDTVLLTVFTAPLLLWRFSRSSAVAHSDDRVLQHSEVGSRAWTALTAVVGILASSGATYWTYAQVQSDGKLRFENLVTRLEADVRAQFAQPLDGLNGMAGFFQATPTMNRRFFQSFWEGRDFSQEFPGVRSMGVLQRVPRTELAQFEAAQRREGVPDFTIKTQGAQPQMYVVNYIVSKDNAIVSLGVDANTEPVRQAALAQAVRTGERTLSGVIHLTPRNGITQLGFLYLMPQYRRDADLSTQELREQALDRVLYSSLVIDDLMARPASNTDGLLVFDLRDSTNNMADVTQAPVVYRTANTDQFPSSWSESRVLDIGGRSFVLHARATPVFESTLGDARHWVVGAVGLLLTLLLSMSVWLLNRGILGAQSMARSLREQSTKLAKAVQLTNNSVIIADADNNIEWVNEAFSRISGIPVQDALGRNAADVRGTQLTDPDALSRIREAFAKGEDVRLQVFHRTREGRPYWLDSDLQVLRAEDGSYAGYLAVETDITEFKSRGMQLNAALMETQALMDTINVHAIVSEADGQGMITRVNDQFCRISGYTEEELVGADHRIVNSGVHPDSFWKDFWSVISTGMPWRGQICNRAKNGSLYWVDSMIAPFIGNDGQIEKFISIRMDITEHKEYERSLTEARENAEQATKSKAQFLANMSHEIRTPMNAILGMLQLVQTTGLNARQQDYVSKADGAAKSLLGLINDILDFSKVEAGKMTLDAQPMRISTLMRDLSVILSANVKAKGLEVLYDLDAALPDLVQADAMRLQQVLINLGGNAIKFTPAGQVIIALRVLAQDAQGVRVEFAVKDSGIGIAPENQAHIFAGFSQAEASTSRRFGGTGLGLAISQRLVHLMGGELALNSVLGAGSTFSFVLDFPLAHAVAGELAEPGQPSLATRRVLIIDDNETAARILLQMTTAWGWPTEVAYSGRDAQDKIKSRQTDGEFPFDVVYVDWQMPGMDGWDVTHWIRQRCADQGAHQPIIVMTSANNRETLAQRKQEEQDLLNAFLVKPITSSMLQEAALSTVSSEFRLRQAKRAGSSHRRLAGMRILVVEDNLINQQVAEELLMFEGATVSLAANGRLGVNAVAAASPQFDVVLMDVQMPVMDGFAATTMIREQLGLTQLPIVAMTANALATDREASLAVGMNEHVGKPFDLAQLVRLLLKVTGRQEVVASVPGADALPSSQPHGTTGLDVEGALARLGGLQSLYLRSLKDFAKALPQLHSEFSKLVATDFPKATMHIHTVKGTASTLGANRLADQAAHLERLCKDGDVSRVTASELEQLAAAVRETQEALAKVIAQIDNVAAPAASTPADASAVRSALNELVSLLEADDMAALEKFAEVRDTISAASGEDLEALEVAMQNLNFADGLAVCRKVQLRISPDVPGAAPPAL